MLPVDPNALRIGIDTGGTFTDFVVFEGDRVTVFKIPSTPSHPEKALLDGLSRIVSDRESYLVRLGSTVATNSLLEGRGAKTALVTNQGFEDILRIGRQNRPGLYQLSASRPECLVPASLHFGVKERLLWDGSVLIPLENRSLDWLRSRIEQLAPESIAVVLLYSYVNPESENRIAEALESTQIPVSLSHRILPEFREYERTSTTVINAYLQPIIMSHLSALRSDPLLERGKLTLMQSNGGSISANSERLDPVRLLLSGPAGGVIGAYEVARQAGYERALTFDMGGTSTDISLCPGKILTTRESTIDHQPVAVQMIALQTVGAGGGSKAWVDAGGLLRVGPQSAGADPGPACYGKGEEVTVTDANVFLGRLDPDFFLGGEVELAPERIQPALERLAARLAQATDRNWSLTELAEGVIQIANTHMEGALRVISLQKGYDTREFTLVTFGGAGGLHACDLARSLLIPRVVVPLNPGLLSATGILRAPVVKDASLTVMMNSRQPQWSERLAEVFAPLENQIRRDLAEEGFPYAGITLQKTLDLRYGGQAYELNVLYADDFQEQFHRLHESFYGYSNPRLPVEIVCVRVRGSAEYSTPPLSRFPPQNEEPPPGAVMHEKQVIFNSQTFPTRFYRREHLESGNRIPGPGVILEYSSASVIPPDFQASIDEWKNIVIEPAHEHAYRRG